MSLLVFALPIEAHDAGAHVLILSKSTKGDPSERRDQCGTLGTMDPEDNSIVHVTDTLKEGEFLADYEKVEVVCKNAPDAVNELVNWGAHFHREEDGRLTHIFLALIHIE